MRVEDVVVDFFQGRYLHVTFDAVLKMIARHGSRLSTHKLLRMVYCFQDMALEVLQKSMCLRILNVVAGGDAADGVGVHVLVGEVTLGVKDYYFFGPLDEIGVVGEHDVLVVANYLGSLALHDHDPSPVDQARVLNWHL